MSWESISNRIDKMCEEAKKEIDDAKDFEMPKAHLINNDFIPSHVSTNQLSTREIDNV